jgi:AMP-activated protein kinase-like protein
MSRRLLGSIAATILVVSPTGARAQADLSLGLGLGTVRFPGGSTLGVLSLSPSLLLQDPGRALDAGGTLARLPSGASYLQGTVGGWMATAPLAKRWRLALEAQISGATTGRGTASGVGRVGVEGVFAAARWGVAAATGPTSGWIDSVAPVTAWHSRLRGWWQGAPGNPDFFASVEPTRFLGAWFTDVSGGLALRRNRIVASVSASARVSAAYGSKAAALAAVELRLTPTVSFEASGGNVLPDPYQGLPASGFVTVGVRVHFPFHPAASTALVHSGPFVAFRRGAVVVIRIRLRGVRVVTVAGDWNDWTPAPLEQSGHGLWEVSLPLSPGPHRFMIMVDGAPWEIPEGVPSVPDGMGARVAVLNVF